MKRILAALAAVLVVGTAHAQRIYNQGELDAMLAPIALQPDGVISQILIASTYPDQVAEAARWSRANPHLSGDFAVRAVQNEPWDPAVKALLAFPDLLIRMDESPQWLRDLGEAFVNQEVQVMDTVQALRQRAQAAGHLSSNDQTVVYPQGEAIVVYPRTHYVYVNYYDPYIVYGPWWWPYYRPVFWRPWAPRPVFVAHGFFYTKPDWHHRHVHVVHKPVHVHQHHVVPGKWVPQKHVVAKPFVRVPESQRKPIVQSHNMPAASGFSHQKQGFVRPQHQPQPQVQGQPRPQMQGQPRPQVQGQPRPQAQGQPRAEARGHAPMVQRQFGSQPSRSHVGNGASFRSQQGNGGGFRGNGGGGGGRGRG
jgi:Protein of unknown function (DUF3300)